MVQRLSISISRLVRGVESIVASVSSTRLGPTPRRYSVHGPRRSSLSTMSQPHSSSTVRSITTQEPCSVNHVRRRASCQFNFRSGTQLPTRLSTPLAKCHSHMPMLTGKNVLNDCALSRHSHAANFAAASSKTRIGKCSLECSHAWMKGSET